MTYRLPSLGHLTPSLDAPAEPADHSRAILAALPVDAEVTGRQVGSQVTRYLLTPPVGTDPRKIERAIDAVSLAVGGDARYAGTIGTAVGIEVPNDTRRVVRLRDLIEAGPALTGLGIVIGQDVGGEVVTASLSRLPHLLVAGATNQGKSVSVNAMLISLLMRCSPRDLRLVLIDPKRVEFSAYAKLPHLLRPVVTDVAEAPGALNDLVTEMERRYALFEALGVEQFDTYNDRAAEKLPRIVLVIDELSDLMSTSRKQVESVIQRLGQKARAAGIHMIVATQHPKATILPTEITANIPSRLALTTTTDVASRLILGVSGAERLTGSGDSLWAPIGSRTPLRVQAPLVERDEIDRIVAFWVAETAVDARIAQAVADGDQQAALAAQEARQEAARAERERLDAETVAARELLAGTTAVLAPAVDVDLAGLVAAKALEYTERWMTDEVHRERREQARERRMAAMQEQMARQTEIMERMLKILPSF